MMKVSRHNSRSGSHGVFNPKHNDREFDVDISVEINSDLTKYNIYWNCFDREIVRHGERSENSASFTDVEKGFYDLVYKDYVEGQNARNTKEGHKERNRTTEDLRTSDKTCPEESIHQIGKLDEHVKPEILLAATIEFLNEVSKRYGSHVHILDWALHVDEGTPHIHERHVFDVINKYGERQPKQEQALKELGFEPPDPTKKISKYNNRKISFDAECRKLLLDICKSHGLLIDEEPIYGGKKYLEKQEFIIKTVNEKCQLLQAEKDQLLADNSSLNEKKSSLQDEITDLDFKKEKKESELADIDSFVKDVTAVAYDKACETIIDELAESIRKETSQEINNLKNEINNSNNLITKTLTKFALEQLTVLQQRLSGIKARAVNSIKKSFSSSAKKEKLLKNMVEATKPSLVGIISKYKEQIAIEDAKKAFNAPAKKTHHEQSL